MLKSYKYRLYPNKAQSELIDRHIGSCRFIYNLGLEVKNKTYATLGKSVSVFELMRQLTDLKRECVWLKDIDSQCLQQSLLNLDKAFTQFFKGHSRFPNFKKKYSSTSFRNPHGSRVRIENGKIYQAKFMDGISLNIDRMFEGEIRSTTISKTKTNKYFVSVLVETGKVIPKTVQIKESTSVGVDMGIKSFIVTSDGLKIGNPKHLQVNLSKIKYLQKQHSKKKKGSKNKSKSRQKLATIHERVVNQRKDFLHKLSTQLIKKHDTLCFESLNIENMVKNRNLSQAIQSAGWGVFITMCKYKAEWNGKNILSIPTFQVSTKLCSVCGNHNPNLTLKDRDWICSNCGSQHDRDINAAINIKKYSLKNCDGGHRKKAGELPTLVGALKQ